MDITSAAKMRAPVQVTPEPAPRAVEAAPRVSRENAAVEPRSRSEWVSRLLNVAIASVALVLVSPIIALFALLVRLTSRGPIFYTQVRIGIDKRWMRGDSDVPEDQRWRDLGGRAFTIYKFRSMYVDAESRSGAVWAKKGDSRITPIGKLMRKSRIDELPQLINVIRNDMNIVGPRPERPSIFARLCEDIEEYPIRQRAKPGITGLAQINHRYDQTLEDVRTKVHYDLQYLQRQSLAEDVRIMAATLPVMLFGKGAC
jgi:lipopolysaccharide/colanic/teichoic acid biosynthesis glycosyltransferase